MRVFNLSSVWRQEGIVIDVAYSSSTLDSRYSDESRGETVYACEWVWEQEGQKEIAVWDEEEDEDVK